MLRQVAFLAAGLLICGCSKPPEDTPSVQLVPIMGSVHVNGEPAIGAQVTLHPVEDVGLGVVTPSGVVDDAGMFTVTTYSVADGAAVGKYRVTVSWAELLNSSGSDPEYGKEKLPARYQRPDQSGLECEVTPDHKELLVLDLKSR